MEFSLADQSDLPELYGLFRAATARMDESGIPQWDEIYPDRSILQSDITNGQMQVCRIDHQIAVAFMLDFCKRGEYEPADWLYDEPEFAVLHRLCVHPSFQGRGLAREALAYIDQSASKLGYRTIRLDVFSQNPIALRLYESNGYRKAGEISYRKGLFYLYEKKL